ncbi:MAG: hypothetical protein FWH21_08825 [Kiritimatiellaeota bacterium]|nr:hypothetical protein [Kiritimatiellota bacterium]
MVMQTQTLVPSTACNPAEAIARFPEILKDVANGAAFMLFNAGTDFVQFVQVNPPQSRTVPPAATKRTGFMTGSVPDDFDTLCADEIGKLFN